MGGRVLAREHCVIVSYDRTIYSRRRLRFSFQCAHRAVAIETKRDLPNHTRTLHREYCFRCAEHYRAGDIVGRYAAKMSSALQRVARQSLVFSGI